MEPPIEISSRVHKWVKAAFPLAQERNIDVTDSLLDSGIIDSLGTLEVVTYLEEEFGVEVSDEEMVADHFDSVLSIASFIASKRLSDGYSQVT